MTTVHSSFDGGTRIYVYIYTGIDFDSRFRSMEERERERGWREIDALNDG